MNNINFFLAWLGTLYKGIRKKQIVDFLTLILILLFTYALVSKAMDLEKFRTQVGQSILLNTIADIAIWFTLGTEFLVIILLFFEMTKKLGLYLSFFLMVMFSAYIFCVTRFTKNIPCACGGILERMTWNAHLIFNLGFVLLIVIAILLKDEARNQDKRGC